MYYVCICQIHGNVCARYMVQGKSPTGKLPPLPYLKGEGATKPWFRVLQFFGPHSICYIKKNSIFVGLNVFSFAFLPIF